MSPVSAADTISDAVAVSEVRYDGGHLYWLEGRPSEGGRQVIVRRAADGTVSDLTSSPVSARTRVNEYGGGSLLVTDGVVYYSDFSDQRLYRLEPGSDPGAITPEPSSPGSVRYADGAAIPNGLLVYVRETHGEHTEAVNDLVLIDPATQNQTVLASGADFYASPRPSRDGTRLAWLEWDHPNMPWDETRLIVAPIGGEPLQVAGGVDQAVIQPSWASDGSLLYVDDPTGWWNLYRWDGNETTPVLPKDAEFGVPPWVLGRSTYVAMNDGRIVTIYFDSGVQRLGVIRGGELVPIKLGFTNHSFLTTDGESRLWFVGHRADGSVSLAEHDLESGVTLEIRGNPVMFDSGCITEPRLISFPTAEGVAHGIFYPPANSGFEASEGSKPPLMVRIHGGPTSAAYPCLEPRYAYWTTRGFGVVDVNYRGSTGFGRDYRRKLCGQWGVVDVEDAAAAARYLVGIGEADPEKVVISGGSAGGFTVLTALAQTDVFSAGACYYGVSDLNLLNDHTHKFESRYNDLLVGSDLKLLTERSPITHVDQITTPVIVFQGLRDRVVPPEQSEMVVAALERNGVHHEYVTYENEDHGFRDAANIVHSLESELAFYGKVLGFTPHS